MSQNPPSTCAQCGTPIAPGQRFCPNCGAAAPQQIAPTVAASPYQSAPSNLSNPNYPGVGQPPNPGYPNYGNPGAPSSAEYPPPPERTTGANNQGYMAYPNTAPSAGSGAYPGYSAPPPPIPPAPPATPYYSAPQQTKKSSPLVAIIIGVLVIVVIGAGLIYFVNKGSGSAHNTGQPGGTGNNSTGNNTQSYAATQNLNLVVTYASDQMTFTSLQQKKKFSDDPETSFDFGQKANYVRLSFSEKELAQDGSDFAYDESFLLMLPDGKTTAKAIGSSTFTAPESGVQRSNWVDFSTTVPVDLSKLTLTLGSSSEAQMTFPLQNNANLAKYNPVTTTPGSQFQYAGLNWTLKSVTKSLYADGQQAKTGQVYITVDLTADNNSQDTTIYLSVGGGFLRLQDGSNVLSPEDNSNLDNFDIVNPNTKGVEGTAVFLVTPTSDGNYTLNFQPADSISPQTQAFQIS